MNFIIDEKLAQSLLNYLAEKPYKEVMMMIQELMRLKPIEEKKEDISLGDK